MSHPLARRLAATALLAGASALPLVGGTASAASAAGLPIVGNTPASSLLDQVGQAGGSGGPLGTALAEKGPTNTLRADAGAPAADDGSALPLSAAADSLPTGGLPQGLGGLA